MFVTWILAACGAVPGASGLPLPSPPTLALAPWSSFPAKAGSRPIIAFADTVEYIPSTGFPDGDRKMAWVCNKFVLARNLALTAEAAAAYAKLMSAREATSNTSSGCATVAPFEITRARMAAAGFPTDRGTRLLPAWLFDVREVSTYVGYLALAPSALWGRAIAQEGRGGRVSTDGMSIKVAVFNAMPGPCGSDYTTAAAESETAVAIAVKEIRRSDDPNLICPAIAVMGSVTVRLKAPLGSRVLVDEDGNAGAACPEDGDC